MAPCTRLRAKTLVALCTQYLLENVDDVVALIHEHSSAQEGDRGTRVVYESDEQSEGKQEDDVRRRENGQRQQALSDDSDEEREGMENERERHVRRRESTSSASSSSLSSMAFLPPNTKAAVLSLVRRIGSVRNSSHVTPQLVLNDIVLSNLFDASPFGCLELSDTAVTDAGIESLTKPINRLKDVTHINIMNCPGITAAGITMMLTAAFHAVTIRVGGLPSCDSAMAKVVDAIAPTRLPPLGIQWESGDEQRVCSVLGANLRYIIWPSASHAQVETIENERPKIRVLSDHDTDTGCVLNAPHCESHFPFACFNLKLGLDEDALDVFTPEQIRQWTRSQQAWSWSDSGDETTDGDTIAARDSRCFDARRCGITAAGDTIACVQPTHAPCQGALKNSLLTTERSRSSSVSRCCSSSSLAGQSTGHALAVEDEGMRMPTTAETSSEKARRARKHAKNVRQMKARERKLAFYGDEHIRFASRHASAFAERDFSLVGDDARCQ